jgi:hypothetical protein
METAMNRILEVTDEEESLVLEFVELDDLRDEGILPRNPGPDFITFDGPP